MNRDDLKHKLNRKRDKYISDLDWEPRHQSPITLTLEELELFIKLLGESEDKQ